MSAEADRYLQNTEDGAFIYISNPELYKRLCGYMESYAREYHQKEMERMLDGALSWAEGNYPTRDGKLCYNAARIEACGELLNHLKQDKG